MGLNSFSTIAGGFILNITGLNTVFLQGIFTITTILLADNISQHQSVVISYIMTQIAFFFAFLPVFFFEEFISK